LRSPGRAKSQPAPELGAAPIENKTVFEVLVPVVTCEELTTVTCAFPAIARSAAAMLAVNWVALTTRVLRAAPFQFTADSCSNPEPFTVRTNAAPPMVACDGDRDVIVGVGMPAHEGSSGAQLWLSWQA
jgi:hypothetical protein